MRLNGAPLGDVYAIGDCSTVQNNVSEHIVHFLREQAADKGKDPRLTQLTYTDWQELAKRVNIKFPQAANHLRRLDHLFQQHDIDKSGTLDFSELLELLRQVDTKLTSLPATAQRANQQGLYLGRKLTKMARHRDREARREAEAVVTSPSSLDADNTPIPAVVHSQSLDEDHYKAFEYKHLGSLAYVGNAAVFDYNGLSFTGGLMAVYLWRSVYFAQSVSLRMRMLMAMDWTKRAMFGRGEWCFAVLCVALLTV